MVLANHVAARDALRVADEALNSLLSVASTFLSVRALERNPLQILLPYLLLEMLLQH